MLIDITYKLMDNFRNNNPAFIYTQQVYCFDSPHERNFSSYVTIVRFIRDADAKKQKISLVCYVRTYFWIPFSIPYNILNWWDNFLYSPAPWY